MRFFCQISFGRHRRLLHNREIGVVVDKPMEKLGPRCETFFSFFLGRSFPVIFFGVPRSEKESVQFWCVPPHRAALVWNPFAASLEKR